MFRRTQCLVLGLLTALGVSQAGARDFSLESPFSRIATQGANGTSDIYFCQGAPQAKPSPAVAQDGPCNLDCNDQCGNGCGGCGNGCDDGCGLFSALGPDGKPRTSLWIWGAPTYYSTSAEALFGFAEGLTAGYRLTESTGLLAQIGFNHTGRSTQILGTVGFQKFGDFESDTLWERSSVWVLWDQYTDTRFSNLYLHQFRFNVGYVPAERREVGMSFSVPTSNSGLGAGAGAMSPLGGPGMLSSGGSFVGPYMTAEVGDGVQVIGQIGYASGAAGTGGVAAGVGLEAPMTERTNYFVDAKYGSQSAWALSTGVAVGLGRADTKRK